MTDKNNKQHWEPTVGQQVKRRGDQSTVYKITHIGANGEISGKEHRPEITPGVTVKRHNLKEFNLEPASAFEIVNGSDAPTPVNGAGDLLKQLEDLRQQVSEVRSLRDDVRDLRKQLDKALSDKMIAERKLAEANKQIDKLRSSEGKQAFHQIRQLQEENKALRAQIDGTEDKIAEVELNFKTLIQRNLRSAGDVAQADREISEWRAQSWKVTQQAYEIGDHSFTRVISMERTPRDAAAIPIGSIFSNSNIHAISEEILRAGQDAYEREIASYIEEESA